MYIFDSLKMEFKCLTQTLQDLASGRWTHCVSYLCLVSNSPSACGKVQWSVRPCVRPFSLFLPQKFSFSFLMHFCRKRGRGRGGIFVVLQLGTKYWGDTFFSRKIDRVKYWSAALLLLLLTFAAAVLVVGLLKLLLLLLRPRCCWWDLRKDTWMKFR